MRKNLLRLEHEVEEDQVLGGAAESTIRAVVSPRYPAGSRIVESNVRCAPADLGSPDTEQLRSGDPDSVQIFDRIDHICYNKMYTKLVSRFGSGALTLRTSFPRRH